MKPSGIKAIVYKSGYDILAARDKRVESQVLLFCNDGIIGDCMAILPSLSDVQYMAAWIFVIVQLSGKSE